jgi:hypothetical protein
MYNGLVSHKTKVEILEVRMQPRRKNLIFWKLVQRENATRYMLISLLSSVATVTIVRSFLALTGYPQIGSSTLHIAHVLWGGLILYIAAILPLIYLNPRLHIIGAVLSGVGVGLFIDEVGKFITRQYDYFFPAAAPIMYVFFLFLIILVIMIRRPPAVDGRAELVQALEMVREQLYRPLDPMEKAHIEQDMNRVMEMDKSILHQDLARHLLELVRADTRFVSEKSPVWWLRIAERIKLWLTEKRLRWLLGIGMALLTLLTLKNPLQEWLEAGLPNSALVAFLQAHSGRQITSIEAQGLYNVRLGLEVAVGLMLLVAVILLIMGKKRLAIDLGYLSLLLSIAVLDMLLFYFEQFSTIIIVVFQFILLVGVIYYRAKFFKANS